MRMSRSGFWGESDPVGTVSHGRSPGHPGLHRTGAIPVGRKPGSRAPTGSLRELVRPPYRIAYRVFGPATCLPLNATLAIRTGHAQL
jgi:hypothetical protein